jgi:hypothetical protein
MATYAPPSFTVKHVAAELDAIILDTLSITDTALGDALSQVMVRAGGHWHVDYFADLHASVTAEAGLPVPLPVTLAHPTLGPGSLTIQRDLSQMITRAVVEGGGVNAATNIVPGETILPLDASPVWYQSAGGLVESGPQRIRYAGIDAGGAGSLVGPGIGPSAAPVATLANGAGIDPGVHGYAVTFRTASGESLPSPLANITVGTRPNPTDAPVPQAATGAAGVTVGVHTYALTDVSASGETLPGPGVVVNVGSLPTPTLAPNLPTPGGYHQNDSPAGWHAGATVNFFTTYGATIDPTLQSAQGPWSANIVLQPHPTNPSLYIAPILTIYGSSDPNVQKLTMWGAVYGGPSSYRCGAQFNNYASITVEGAPDPTTIWAGPHAELGHVPLAIGAYNPGITQRKLYRTAAGGTQLKLVGVVGGGATYTDTLPDSGLGANAPTVNTAIAAQVALSAIPTGSGTVNGRKIYRTAAGASQLKLLATLGDNTTTVYTDAAADAALGANLPAGDTSGIQQPNGQVLPGSPTLPVAGIGAFVATGGWAIIGNGQQAIRYTSIVGGNLSGIPAIGPGAIVAAVSYNSTATAAPALRGIPSTGTGSIRYQINSGDPVDLLIIVDDVDAQTLLASLIGGSGIKESKITDGRIGVAEATARGNALLAQRKTIDVALHYTVRDPNTVSGATVHVDLPPPHNVFGDYQIQDVMLSAFSAIAGRPPTATVQASTARYTFDDLLRISRSAVGVDPNGTGT